MQPLSKPMKEEIFQLQSEEVVRVGKEKFPDCQKRKSVRIRGGGGVGRIRGGGGDLSMSSIFW